MFRSSWCENQKLTRAGARDAFASKKDLTSVSGQINATWNYVWLGEFGEVFSAICYIGFPIVFFWLLPCNFSYNHGSLNLEVYDISWYLVISRYVHISLRLKTIHGIQKVNFLQGWQNTWGDHQTDLIQVCLHKFRVAKCIFFNIPAMVIVHQLKT